MWNKVKAYFTEIILEMWNGVRAYVNRTSVSTCPLKNLEGNGVTVRTKSVPHEIEDWEDLVFRPL